MKATIISAWATRFYGPLEEVGEEEYYSALRLWCVLAGISPELLKHVSEKDVVATMQAWDQEEAAQASAKRGRGRPATPHKHLRIMLTIEAYIGAGLTREEAIDRATENWCLSRSHIEDIYKGKFRQVMSKQIRAYFEGDTPEVVDAAIKQYLENERG
jgi:hypothetical protein